METILTLARTERLEGPSISEEAVSTSADKDMTSESGQSDDAVQSEGIHKSRLDTLCGAKTAPENTFPPFSQNRAAKEGGKKKEKSQDKQRNFYVGGGEAYRKGGWAPKEQTKNKIP